MESLDLEKLDEEDVQLLEELRTSSKRETLALLQTNFGHLVGIFKILKPEFESLFEEGENSKLEVEDEFEEEEKDGDITPGIDSESDSKETESETEEVSSDEENLPNRRVSVHSYNSVRKGQESIDQASEMSETERQSDSQFEETDDQSDTESDYESVVTVSGPKTKTFGL